MVLYTQIDREREETEAPGDGSMISFVFHMTFHYDVYVLHPLTCRKALDESFMLIPSIWCFTT